MLILKLRRARVRNDGVRSVVPLEIPLSSQNVSLVDRFRGAP